MCMCKLVNGQVGIKTPPVPFEGVTTTCASEVFVPVDDRKTSPVQVAVDDQIIVSVCYVFALVVVWKHTTSRSCRGSRPSWTLVGAGCSNQWKLAQTLTRTCPCTTCIWLLHPKASTQVSQKYGIHTPWMSSSRWILNASDGFQ